MARLAALGLLAGILAGAGAARDIEQSFDKGRIAPAAAATAVPADPIAPASPSVGDRDLASTHGYALAAELRFTGRDDCRTVEPALRPGCLDYVDDRAAGAPGALDPLL